MNIGGKDHVFHKAIGDGEWWNENRLAGEIPTFFHFLDRLPTTDTGHVF